MRLRLWCLIVIVSVFLKVHICSSTEMKSKLISRYFNLANTSNMMSNMYSGLSPLKCAVQCVSEVRCQSFSYTERTGRCRHFTSASSCMDSPEVKGKPCFYIIQAQAQDAEYRCPVELNFTLYEEKSLCVKVGMEDMSWYDANRTCGSYSPASRIIILDSRHRIDQVLMAVQDTHRQIKMAVWIAEVKKDNPLNAGKTFSKERTGRCWVVMLKQKNVSLTGTCSYKQGFVCEVPLNA